MRRKELAMAHKAGVKTVAASEQSDGTTKKSNEIECCCFKWVSLNEVADNTSQSITAQ